jgi:hypothetical protein
MIGSINPSIIQRMMMAWINIVQEGVIIRTKTTKAEMEEHLLQWNPKAYWDIGDAPFGYTPLRKELGPHCNSPMEESIINDIVTHHNNTVQKLTKQLKWKSRITQMDAVMVSNRDYSLAFNGLHNGFGKVSLQTLQCTLQGFLGKISDQTSHMVCLYHARMMKKYTKDLHLVIITENMRHECVIYKKPGNHQSDTLCIIYIIKVSKIRVPK